MFKIALKTFRNEIVYKLTNRESQEKIKISLAIFGKGIFDKISLYFLQLLSGLFPGLKPKRVSIGVKETGKMYATLAKIENFALTETQVFLAKENKTVSTKELQTSISETIAEKSALGEIHLPDLLKEVHAKHLRDILLMQRNFYIQLHNYLKTLPDSHNRPIVFSYSEDGSVGKINPESKLWMGIKLDTKLKKIVIKPVGMCSKIYPKLENLYTELDVESWDQLTPISVANQLKNTINENFKEEFTRFLSFEAILKKPKSSVAPVTIELKGKREILSMHKISLHGNYYFASQNWDYNKAELFWTSVFEEKPAVIVKLTKETPSQESPLYWPNSIDDPWEFPDSQLSVRCLCSETLNENLIKRTFELKKGSLQQQVVHLDFLGWENFGVPKITEFKNLVSEVDAICPQSTPDSRIMVHCVGGAGRTGAFIAAHSAKKIPKENHSEAMFYDLVMELRRQRPKQMVETPSQYLFIRRFLSLFTNN